MRHVRMLGLCLVAVLAVAAVAASSALAVVKNPTHSWKIWDNCPVNGEAHGVRDLSCVFGATEVNEGGQFTVGPITVPLVKQIVLQYGLTETPLEPEIFVPPAHGAEAISATPEKVPGEPIAHVTPAEQQELGWPETLQYSYAQAQKHHSVRTAYETIELAGVPVTHIENIVNEEGIGLEAPVKIKAENKWLAELGDVCYVGSNAEPIVQHLTAATSESPLTHEIIHGFRGEFEIQEGPRVVLTHSNLVDNTYAVPAATCTGPYSSVIAATINKEFGLPEPAGASVTEIKGTLYSVSAARAEEHGANGA